jgi:hypothetical protein
MSHLLFLLEKESLGLTIVPGESEEQTFIDCKNHYGQEYPLMYPVEHTRADKILVQGEYECISMSSYAYLDMMRDADV